MNAAALGGLFSAPANAPRAPMIGNEASAGSGPAGNGRFSQMLRDCDLPRSTEPVKPPADNAPAPAPASANAEPKPSAQEGRTEAQRQDARTHGKRSSDAAKAAATPTPGSAAAPAEKAKQETDTSAASTGSAESAAEADETEKADKTDAAQPLNAQAGAQTDSRPGTPLLAGLLHARTAAQRDAADASDASEASTDSGGGSPPTSAAARRSSSAAAQGRARADAPVPTADLARSFATELKDATSTAAAFSPALAAAQAKAAGPARADSASVEALLGAAAQAPSHASAAAHAGDVTQPASATLAQPLYSPGFVPEMAARISVWAADGVQQAQLHLNPAEMGPVAVQIVVEGQQAQISFHAEQADTRAVLERSLPDLAAALRDAGLTLSGGGVFQQMNGQGGQARESAGSEPQRRTLRAGNDEAPGSASLPAPRALRGVVDLYA